MTLTAEQLAARRSFVGSSDTPMLFNASPFGGPADVYYRKVQDIDTIDTAAITMGKYLEPGILDWFEDRIGYPIRRHQMVWDGASPWGANCDGVIVHKDGLLPVEAKAACFTGDQYLSPDTDDVAVPLHVYLQVQHQMMCLDAPYGFVAALVGWRGFEEYRVEADKRVWDAIRRRAESFWRDCVLARRVPTDIPPRMETMKVIERHHKTVDIPADVLRAYAEARSAASAADKVAEDRKRTLCAALGDADEGQCEAGIVTYHANKNGVRALKIKETTDER